MALADNLLRYYKMDGNSQDSVGSNHGSDTSMSYSASYAKIIQGAGFLTNPSGGSPNTANNWIQIAALNFGTSAFSMSMWVRFLAIDADQQALFKEEQNGATGRPYIALGANNAGFYFGADDGSGNNGDAQKLMTVSTGVWYHVVVTRSGTTYKIYVDNATAVTGSFSGGTANLGVSDPSNLGRRYNSTYSGNQDPFNGYMDEVAFWNREITASEVSQLYNSGNGLQYPFGASVQTDAETNLSNTSVTANGTVTSLNGTTLVERGIVYSTTPAPTIANSKVAASGITAGAFSAGLTGLTPGTTYYYRAYATTNAAVTTYGVDEVFTTSVAPAREVWKDIAGVEGRSYAVRLTVGGTVGSVTVRLGSTGTLVTIPAGTGVYTFSGTYGGTTGVIITASADFNGYIDDFMYTVLVPLAVLGDIDWSLALFSTALPISSSVLFRRIEDEEFNRMRIYRYLDLQFKDMDADVTLTIKKEKNDNVTTVVDEFVVGGTSGAVSPFVKKRVSFLAKVQALLIGLSNAEKDQTFTVTEYQVSGMEMPRRGFKGSQIISVE